MSYCGFEENVVVRAVAGLVNAIVAVHAAFLALSGKRRDRLSLESPYRICEMIGAMPRAKYTKIPN